MGRAERPVWLLVCGGFHQRGGMDRANAALARFLSERGDDVRLAAHDMDGDMASLPGVTVTIVPRPAGSAFAGELALAAASRRLRRELRAAGRAVTLVGNGGNAPHADVNWVHSVHAVWGCEDAGAPAWFRAKNRLYKGWARKRERRALHTARTVIANSERTRRDLITSLGLAANAVHTVYLGSDPRWQPPSQAVRCAARQRWTTRPGEALVAFVGALGHDTNKGIDVMLAAWHMLRQDGWTGQLVVAGAGDLPRWRELAAPAGDTIRFVGHTPEVGDLLNAADVLVSPVRYEAYGLAVHEAMARGVPVIVSRDAGVVERLPANLLPLTLPARPAASDVASALRTWASDTERWHANAADAARTLNHYSEREMAARIIHVAEATK